MRPCFKFLAKADGKPTVLAIDDEIGFWGTQAKDFRAALNAVASDELIVEINSPGGEVFAGLGMFNMIRSFASQSGKSVTTRVTGIAASIASVIVLAGDKREMPKNAFAMIHAPWSFAAGTADELREQADVLDKIKSSLRSVYVDRMGASEADVDAMLAKDTWLTADECLEMGFATQLTEDITASASFNLARADLPENVKSVFKARESSPPPADPPADPPAPNDPPADPPADPTPVAQAIEQAAISAQLGDFAAIWAVSCASLVEAQAKIQEAREIKALCAVAKQDTAAVAAIRAGKSIADVRAELVTLMAKVDETTHTDNTRSNEQTRASATPTATTAEIWASRKKGQK